MIYYNQLILKLYRRAPPEPGHYRDKDYQDKREKFQDRFTADRYNLHYYDLLINMIRQNFVIIIQLTVN